MLNPRAAHAPSVTLPLRYLVAATVAFAVAALGLPWLSGELAGHYYHPRLLALTHTVTLGWITLTIMGASYQLIPIVLERPLWSERLARWQFVGLVAGIVGMVGHFFIGQWSGLLWGAGLVVAGSVTHVVNVALTVRGLRRWTFTARLVLLAHVGFALTLLWGLALAVDKVWRVLPPATFPLLHAHLHLALLGWVLPMVLGVAARVYPMFLLSTEPAGWPGRVQLAGVALGVPMVVAGILVSEALLAAGALAVAAALVAHGVWVVRMVRSRRRPALDWGLRLVLAGTLFLVPAAALGLVLAFDLTSGPRVALAYAVLALGGWASLTIAGMMLKIVPFLVWYRAYGALVGRAAVPTLAQLSWPAGERVAAALLVAGVAGLAVAVGVGTPEAIAVAGGVTAAGALALAAVIGHVLHHLMPCPLRRAPAPLVKPS